MKQILARIDIKMEKLRTYKRQLKILNILLEAVMIFAAYWIATFLRFIIPAGNLFGIFDSIKFMILAFIFTGAFILVTYAMGGYFSFRVATFGEIKKVALSAIIGLCIDCTIIYLFKMEQFSRLLLLYFTVLSFAFIYIKRIILSRIASKYAQKYKLSTSVIMFGCNRGALTAYRTVFEQNVHGMKLIGYIGESENNQIPGYLGKYDSEYVIPVGEDEKPDMLVIADESFTREQIKRVVVFATNHGMRVCVIPEFSEFMPSKNAISSIGGNYFCEMSAFDTCNIMGVNISVTNMEKTVNKIKDNLQDWRGKYICVSNVHTTVTASEDDGYKDIQNKAVIALPDGGPLSKFSREKGYEGAARVTGPDLMKRVLNESGANGWRHYFYGSTQETLDKLEKVVEERYPGAYICGMYSPPFRPLSIDEDKEICNTINDARPDFIWVGLGAPKQEVWMAAHEGKVNGLMIGVGAAFDYEAGNIKRAPKWMQDRNLEWFYRLMQDPKRLFSRYLKTNTKYLMWKYQHGGKD